MIDDGYSRHVCLRGPHSLEVNVWYRPATRGERDRFRHFVKFLSEKTRQIAIYDWVRQHIVASDIPRVGEKGSWAGLQWFDEQHPELFGHLFQAINGVVADTSGSRWVDIEMEWQQNLKDGIALERSNPRLARRSCADCLKYWYSEKTGLPIKNHVTGLNELRIAETLCQTEIGCAKGTPEKQKSLNRANRWAVKHYLECEAVGHFPDDPIVRGNAVIIRNALSKRVVK